ncbi:MAG: PfkB family carbohydrate kinase [Candidatus Goldbacteria bacterium]|nr:PfkB family carbohydrate kinase [Candidatus Goldiibacteriota bacterium]
MQKALLVGATHIDILANTSLQFDGSVGKDLPGEFVISVGGTAFNVCVNLMGLNLDCFLVSVTKKDSLFTYLIEQTLKGLKIKHYIFHPEHAKESAFLAIRDPLDLIMAVTAQAWDSLTNQEFDEILTKITSRQFDFAVVDCNLPALYIKKLLEALYPTPLYLCATSTAKFIRFLAINMENQGFVKAFFMNEEEYSNAINLFKEFTTEKSLYFVTQGEKGVKVIEGNNITHYPPPEIEEPKSFSGAGDAFASGVIYGLQNGYSINDAVSKGFAMVIEKAKYQHSNTAVISLEKISDSFIKDKLTDTFNRNTLENDKVMLCDFSHVIVIDIDHFKKINDTYGHTAGDVVLHNIAQIIREASLPEGIACRYGGEEMIIFLREKIDDEAYNKAEKIRKMVKKALIKYKNKTIKVTMSIGVASTKSGLADIHKIIKRADENVYKAKKAGRDRVVM